MKEENTSIWPVIKKVSLILVAILFFIAGVVLGGIGLVTFILTANISADSWRIYAPCFALSVVCFVLGRFILRLSKNTPAAEQSETRNQIERGQEKGPSASPEEKRKKSQLIGYTLCWVCAPVFFFFAAFCDRKDYCDALGTLALLFLLSAIPLIIGQVVLYRSKRTFPPLDAMFFLTAALCEATVLLLHAGMILWGIGFILEIILLLYVLVQQLRETLSEEQSDEEKK